MSNKCPSCGGKLYIHTPTDSMVPLEGENDYCPKCKMDIPLEKKDVKKQMSGEHITPRKKTIHRKGGKIYDSPFVHKGVDPESQEGKKLLGKDRVRSLSELHDAQLKRWLKEDNADIEQELRGTKKLQIKKSLPERIDKFIRKQEGVLTASLRKQRSIKTNLPSSDTKPFLVNWSHPTEGPWGAHILFAQNRNHARKIFNDWAKKKDPFYKVSGVIGEGEDDYIFRDYATKKVLDRARKGEVVEVQSGS